MLVTFAIAAVCVIGIIGAIASTLGYDQLYGQESRGAQLPPRAVRRSKPRRPSRQLRAVETALATADSSRVKRDPHLRRR